MIYEFMPYKASKIIKNHLKMGSSSPGGGRIDANSLYFTKDGRPFIGVMGEYHFSRAHSRDWYRELCKMKAGGVNIVSTYLFWIYHEETEGKLDFSGDLDIRKFIADAQKAGLYAFIRIGPWAHGECRNGGFPDWLVKKPYKLRQNDPAYMEKARSWYAAIYAQLKGLFYPEGGNIIGIQFENELVDRPEHLKALKDMALALGFSAPIYTVTGWNSVYGAKIPSDEFVPVFGGYADAPWDKSTRKLPLSPHYAFSPERNDAAIGLDVIKQPAPDGWMLPYERYPFATCELGAGLHSTYHRRYIFKPMDAYAMSLVKLGCGNNLIGYYMYHGGENKIGALSTFNESRETGYPNDYPVLDYDYQTAIGTYGQTREQYGLLNLLHLFVSDFGCRLAPMEYVPAAKTARAEDLKSLRYALRSDGESGFVFVNHYQRLAELEDIKRVTLRVSEDVVFPEFDLCGETCFIFPYNLEMGSAKLKTATAQPLCVSGDTYFFTAVPGISPVFSFEDGAGFSPEPGLDSLFSHRGINVLTLSFEQAKYLRRLESGLYLGVGRDVYELSGEIRAAQPGPFEYYKWDGHKFVLSKVKRPYTPARFTLEDCKEPFRPQYARALCPMGERPHLWKKLGVDGDEGLIKLDLPCDAAQLYVDGRLAADMYYCGLKWSLPAFLLHGRECYIVYTPENGKVYREYGPDQR